MVADRGPASWRWSVQSRNILPGSDSVVPMGAWPVFSPTADPDQVFEAKNTTILSATYWWPAITTETLSCSVRKSLVVDFESADQKVRSIEFAVDLSQRLRIALRTGPKSQGRIVSGGLIERTFSGSCRTGLKFYIQFQNPPDFRGEQHFRYR